MKPRQPLTAEWGLERAIALIGIAAAAAAGGKSESLARKWADPDADEQIHLFRAMAIDAACMQATGEAPIADVMARAASAVHFAPDHVDLVDVMLESTSAIGRLSETVRQARAPTGPGGHRITNGEGAKIVSHVHVLRRMLDDIEASVTAESNGVTHLPTGRSGKVAG